MVAQYAPTRREHLLDHALRQQIIDRVEKRPGISKGDLREALDCSWGTIHHHLGLLSREKFIKVVPVGPQLRYFLPGLDKRVIDSMAVLRQGRALEIAAKVMEDSGQKQTQILQDIDMSRKILRPHIERLTKAGLIKEVRKDGCCRYHPTTHLKVIMKVIMAHTQNDAPGDPPGDAS